MQSGVGLPASPAAWHEMIISEHDHDDKINEHCQVHVNKSEQLPGSMRNNTRGHFKIEFRKIGSLR